jgi:hypothetical protein
MKIYKRSRSFVGICFVLMLLIFAASACDNYTPAVMVEGEIKYYFTLPAEEFEKAYNKSKDKSMPEEKFKEYIDPIDQTKHIADTESKLDGTHINLAFAEDKTHIASVTLTYFSQDSSATDDFMGAMKATIKALNVPVSEGDFAALEDWTSDGKPTQTKTIIVKDKNEKTETKLYLVLSRNTEGELQLATFQLIAQAQSK